MRPIQGWFNPYKQNDAHKVHFHLHINQKDLIRSIPSLPIIKKITRINPL